MSIPPPHHSHNGGSAPNEGPAPRQVDWHFVKVIENGRTVFTATLSGLSTGGFLAGPGALRDGDQIDFDAELISQEGAFSHHDLRVLRLQKI